MMGVCWRGGCSKPPQLSWKWHLFGTTEWWSKEVLITLEESAILSADCNVFSAICFTLLEGKSGVLG